MSELKLVYTAPGLLTVANLRNLLERVGIACTLRNEYLGGGAGELPLNDIWPEIWVDEADAARAEQTIQEALRAGEGPDWYCHNCGEVNGPGFELCWNCGAMRSG